MAISKDAFTPNRGTQDQIIKAAIENGNIYFSKDTNQIFCDIDGERHTMSHDGVRFLYGHASSEDIGVDTINEKYTIPKSKINASPYPHYELDMIIVNIPDSTFYRVNEITDKNVVCSKILVSGSGDRRLQPQGRRLRLWGKDDGRLGDCGAQYGAAHQTT